MALQRVPGSGSGSGTNSGYQFLSSPFGDTTYTKVFVGGLAWETQSETLRRYFEQFGDILEAVVICDKNTGRSKGYGFVTFRDPESARRACANPSPVIDGRRANCNLASLGRSRPPLSYARLRPYLPYFGAAQGGMRGAYMGNPAYQPIPYGLQRGFSFPPYGYTMYGPEYVYPQNLYSPFIPQQYLQIYGIPGPVNSAILPYGQLGQLLPSEHGYSSAVQGYAFSGQPFVQWTRSNTNEETAGSLPAIQSPQPTGMVVPSVQAQPQFIVPSPSAQLGQGSGSDQARG